MVVVVVMVVDGIVVIVEVGSGGLKTTHPPSSGEGQGLHLDLGK